MPIRTYTRTYVTLVTEEVRISDDELTDEEVGILDDDRVPMQEKDELLENKGRVIDQASEIISHAHVDRDLERQV